MNKELALEELLKLMGEFGYEIECGNNTHAESYQAVGFAVNLIEDGGE